MVLLSEPRIIDLDLQLIADFVLMLIAVVILAGICILMYRLIKSLFKIINER